VRLVFVHGWALGPDIWDGIASRLDAYEQIRADFGYFGQARALDARPGDVLIGHSAGFAWGLRQRRDWAAMVAINSFSRFPLDAEGRGCVKPAALRAMERDCARDAEACVKNFRASIGAPPPLGPAQATRLAEGLALLRDFDAAPLFAESAIPCLILAAEGDSLVPAEESRRLAEICGARLALSPQGGHGTPWTAPEFCAKRIAEYLRSHAH